MHCLAARLDEGQGLEGLRLKVSERYHRDYTALHGQVALLVDMQCFCLVPCTEQFHCRHYLTNRFCIHAAAFEQQLLATPHLTRCNSKPAYSFKCCDKCGYAHILCAVVLTVQVDMQNQFYTQIMNVKPVTQTRHAGEAVHYMAWMGVSSCVPPCICCWICSAPTLFCCESGQAPFFHRNHRQVCWLHMVALYDQPGSAPFSACTYTAPTTLSR